MGRLKGRTTISIDPELVEAAKAAGLNISGITEDALRAKLDNSSPRAFALRMAMEIEKIDHDIRLLRSKKKRIKKDAKKVLGMPLEKFMEQADEYVDEAWQKAIAWLLTRMIDKKGRLTENARKKTPFQMADIYSQALRTDFGITGQAQVKVCEDALQRARDQVGGDA